MYFDTETNRCDDVCQRVTTYDKRCVFGLRDVLMGAKAREQGNVNV